MTVLAQPRQPLRLLGVFAASLAGFALIAAAAGSVLYIIDNETAATSAPLGFQADVDLPPGMVLVRPIESADQWRDALGFAPILPESLPPGLNGEPLYFLQQPDARGRVAGHIRFSTDGGPTLILVEQQGQIVVERPLRAQESESSVGYLEAFACGSVVVQTQLYFSKDTPVAIDPDESLAVAQSFSDALRAQCGD